MIQKLNITISSSYKYALSSGQWKYNDEDWQLPFLSLRNLKLEQEQAFIVQSCACVCVCERERERDRQTDRVLNNVECEKDIHWMVLKLCCKKRDIVLWTLQAGSSDLSKKYRGSGSKEHVSSHNLRIKRWAAVKKEVKQGGKSLHSWGNSI